MEEDVDVPDETELTFAVAVVVGTLCCCATMSCVALCIKLVTWMFGHRGVRRLLHRSRCNSNAVNDDDIQMISTLPRVVYRTLDQENNGVAAHPSELARQNRKHTLGGHSGSDLCLTRPLSRQDGKGEPESVLLAGLENDVLATSQAEVKEAHETVPLPPSSSTDRNGGDEEHGLSGREGLGGG